MPALLKGDVVLFAPDAILDGHLPIILGVVFGLVFDFFWPVVGPPWSPVEWTFRRFGPIVIGLARPLFRPLLVPLLDRVFRHFQTRTCSLPYKKSSDVTLPIANKSAHPLRVRFLGK
jgi:hypothetical protein